MLYLILFILIAGSLFLIWLIFDLKKKLESSTDKEKMAVVLDRLEKISWENKNLRDDVDGKLSETHKATQEQIKSTMQAVHGMTNQSAKQIADVVEGLTKLETTNQQVVNFSAQLKNLQDILKNPKQRGVLGEYYLEEILRNVLPPKNFQTQYSFKDGTIVDAVIFIQNKVIPIDSKFSLENYEKIINSQDDEEREKLEKAFKQDLKNRIDETAKYIKPEDGTMEFAFMFIPSEAIYYDLLVNKIGAIQVNTRDLIQYAIQDKRVIIVSPTSFHAYLQTVLQGLKALQIEEGAKQIRINVGKLEKHMLAYDTFFKKLGGHINTTVNSYNNAYKEFGKVSKDVAKITEGESVIEPLALEKTREE